MRIDEQLPTYDATSIQHTVIDADPARVYVVTLEADFVEAARHSSAIRTLFAMRAAPAGIARRLRRRPAPPSPGPMRLLDMPADGEWVRLDEDFGREIVFGAIGRFWGREIRWLRSEAADFSSFQEPGYGKIAANFSLRPYGDGRTVLSYEARTQATDPCSRRRFLRYWRLVSPFVGVVMRAMLAYVKAEAERPYTAETPPPSRAGPRAEESS